MGELTSKDIPMTGLKLASPRFSVRSLSDALTRLRLRCARVRLATPEHREVLLAFDPLGESDMPSAAMQAAIVAALDGLPERARQVFVMSRVDRLSYAEIARALRIPQWMVRRAMARAIADLYDAVLAAASEEASPARSVGRSPSA
jgi:RNA polymerase sigma factor (sigma-70 family)